MISFTCEKCGKTFKVPDEFAGRTAKCKICGNALTVPALITPAPAQSNLESRGVLAPDRAPDRIPARAEDGPALLADPTSPTARETETHTGQSPKKVPMRTRRLRADADAMSNTFRKFPAIKVTPLAGNPPEAYRVQYTIKSLKPGPDGQPVPSNKHEIEIQLTSEYPRLSPKCKILTPIFHPNFDASTICVGDHWTAGERLVDLVIRIGEMIAFQAYNIQSPLDGNAAMWADLNRAKLPTDSRNLHPVDLE